MWQLLQRVQRVQKAHLYDQMPMVQTLLAQAQESLSTWQLLQRVQRVQKPHLELQMTMVQALALA
jgi:hypothetical protein